MEKTNGEKKLRFLTFWALNGSLEIQKLKKQLKAMKEAGFEGTVFHPRYYPNEPAYLGNSYMAILSELILYAKALKMEFWIYDENGWPSGHAGGQVMEALGDCVCQYLVCEEGKIQKKEFHEVNTLSKEAMRRFVEITYDGYRKGLSEEAFAYVTGFFSDEVGFLDGHGISMQMGGIPWHDDIPVKYEKRYQERWPESLESLFEDMPGHEKIRYRFWEILTDILAENYYQRINTWCEKYGKRYAAHLKGEENLFFQISPSGSAFRNLIQINTPAVDALERYPGNHYYPKIASSISRQFGDGECMAEVMGGSGWGVSPEDLERYVDWLAECGITMYVFHISQYKKNTASVYDWPPDIPFGLNWRQVFPQLFDKLHRRWDGCVGNEAPALLVAPTRRVMSEYVPEDAMQLNEHNGAQVPDTKSGRCSSRFGAFVEQMYGRGLHFDVAEEWIVERYGKEKDGSFYLGSQKYQLAIYSADCLWEDEKKIETLRRMKIIRSSDEFVWSFQTAGSNQILLENGDTVLEYCGRSSEKRKGWAVVSLDELSRLTVMGERIDSRREGDWYWYDISDFIRQRAADAGAVSIHYEGTVNQPKPIVFLQGNFLVKSKEGYTEYGERQVTCTGMFCIEDGMTNVDCQNLVASGFPFMREAVTVTCKNFVGADGICRLGSAEQIYAEAAKIFVDGQEYGYVWGPGWSLSGISPGLHTVTLHLIPSTYNTYGPHHYYRGDIKVTSPAQYSGEKNFADDADAPLCTKDEKWHFVKFGIG